jgi:hypothetical protein
VFTRLRCCCCSAGCTVAAQLLRCNLTAPFPKTLTLTAKGSKTGTFTNKVELRSPDSQATDQADVTIVAPNVETCATWVKTNGCGAGNVLNDKNAGRVLNDTSNAAAVKLICCVSAAPKLLLLLCLAVNQQMTCTMLFCCSSFP